MKKIIAIVLAVIVLATVGGVVYAGDSQPASKATAKMGDIAWLETQSVWTPILTQTIKTANAKDLLVDVSLQCGIYTETVVLSKQMQKDLANAYGEVAVRVKLIGPDEVVSYAWPGENGVVFESRDQTLWAILQGEVILEATLVDPDEVPDSGDEYYTYALASGDPEEIGLILDTMSANSFNFVLPDVTAGVQTVVVEACLTATTGLGGTELGSAVADAGIGYGSVTIEQVRMIKGVELIEVVE